MRFTIIVLLQLATANPRSRCVPLEHSCALEADGIVFHVKVDSAHYTIHIGFVFGDGDNFIRRLSPT